MKPADAHLNWYSLYCFLEVLFCFRLVVPHQKYGRWQYCLIFWVHLVSNIWLLLAPSVRSLYRRSPSAQTRSRPRARWALWVARVSPAWHRARAGPSEREDRWFQERDSLGLGGKMLGILKMVLWKSVIPPQLEWSFYESFCLLLRSAQFVGLFQWGRAYDFNSWNWVMMKVWSSTSQQDLLSNGLRRWRWRCGPGSLRSGVRSQFEFGTCND